MRGAGRLSGLSLRTVGAELFVFAVALIPRLGLIIRSGGPRGTFGYDPAVYYAAADALLHHRMPYRGFVLLHPPGMMLFLSPFAWLGNLTTDHRGFEIASLAFIVIGALNAALVVRVARTSGLSRGAAVIGGLLYAAWPGTADSEFTIQLETLGTFFLLLALLAYWRSAASGQQRWPVLCGAAAGAAASVKILWAVPLVLLALWHLAPARRRALPRYLLGAAVALLLINGPFFAAAPRQMWSMVVSDQLGRGAAVSLQRKLTGITGAQSVVPHLASHHAVLVVTVAVVVAVVMCALALRAPGGALAVTLLVVTCAVLIESPSWFPHYNGFVAPGLTLTAAGAASTVGNRLPHLRWAVAAPVLAAVTALLIAATLVPSPPVWPYPGASFARAAQKFRCVMADGPMPQIEMNVLSRDLHNGCQNWVDVTGRTYEPGGPKGDLGARARDPRWQQALINYLFSGQAVTIYRPSYTGIGPELRRRLHRAPVLARGNGYVLRRTSP